MTRKLITAVFLTIAFALTAFATPTFAKGEGPFPQPIPPEGPPRFVQTVTIRERGSNVWQSGKIEIRPNHTYDVVVRLKNIGGAGKAVLKVKLPLNVDLDTRGNIVAIVNGEHGARLELTAAEPITINFAHGSATVTNRQHKEGVMLGGHSNVILQGIDLGGYNADQGATVSFAFETIGGTFPALPVTSGYTCEYEIPTLFSDGFAFAHYAHQMPHGDYMPTRLEVLRKIHELAHPQRPHDEDTVTRWARLTGLISGRGSGNYAWNEMATQSEIYTILDNYARIFQGEEATTHSPYTTTGFPKWAQPGVRRACDRGYFVYDWHPREGMPYEVFVHILDHTAIGGGM